MAVAAALLLGFASSLRHVRKLGEFKERYPAWKELDSSQQRRWWRRR